MRLNYCLFFMVGSLVPAALLAGADDSWQVYDDSSLARIEVTLDPTSLSWILTHTDSDSEFIAVCRFQNRFLNERIDSIGFRLRGNTSREAAKKSFKISFNSFVRGRQFHGLDKLNLNGEHNDPAIIRSKLCFDLYQDIGRVASRASHARLYINGRYYGLYISVEHIDDEFIARHFADDSGNLWKCLYPADLTFLGNDPRFYMQLSSGGRPAYELTTNEERGDFSPLARFIRVLNLTPAALLPDSLEALLDVPGVLQYFAMNTLVGSWDDYRALMNNYYLYYEPSTARFTLIPYDYDNTFGVDWFGVDWSAADPYNFPKVAGGQRPLAEKLLAYYPWRDLYTHFLYFYRSRVFDLAQQEERINRLRALITTAALEDSFRTMDYHFTAADWSGSYSAGSYSNQHVKFGLKQYILRRAATLPAQLRYAGGGPVVYRIDIAPKQPAAGDSLHIDAACFASAGLARVTLLYTPDGAAQPNEIAMQPHPVAGSKKVEEADRWSAVLPPLPAGAGGSLRLLARDSLDVEQLFPRKRALRLQAAGVSDAGILLNEFMADNSHTVADAAGEFDDWIELCNSGSTPLALDGLYLSDKRDRLTKWRFTQTGRVLAPGDFIVVWCDEQPEQGSLHTNFKLSAGGEFIALTDNDGVTILDSHSFGPQSSDRSRGRWPDGSGTWQSLPPSPGAANQNPASVAYASLPGRFELQAWPNPFNAQTRIQYELPRAAQVTLQLYNVIGQQIATLQEGHMESGLHSLLFDAAALPAGLYFCRLEAAARTRIIKLLVVK
ncbi:MAG TPA: CotH kinase family protein [bacterium]|nr:CotH kinase family protein [bacterium]